MCKACRGRRVLAAAAFIPNPKEFREEPRPIRRVLSFRASSPEILVPKSPNGISASFWKTRQLLTAEASQKHPLGMQCETTFLSQLVGEVPSTGFICESTVSSKVARWAS